MTISIIALLLALLLPAMTWARFSALDVSCRETLHQWGVAFMSYAAEHEGHLPRHDMVSAGGNLWDMAFEFQPTMESYGMRRSVWFCPLTPSFFRADPWVDAPGTFYHFAAYSVWVPRKQGVRMIPSAALGYPTTLDDPAGVDLPIVTDIVWRDTAMTVGDGGFVPMAWHKLPGGSRGYTFTPTHRGLFWPYGSLPVPDGPLINGNLLFVDGHVESKAPAEMAYRYTGNIHHFH